MDKRRSMLRQLNSLERLRNMQRVQSAGILAIANRDATEAAESLMQAQAKYHLAVELQRRGRAFGQAIDPVLYGLQTGGADMVRQTMVESQTALENARADQREAQLMFSTKHAEHKLIKEATHSIHDEICAEHAKGESLDVQDHAACVYAKGEAP